MAQTQEKFISHLTEETSAADTDLVEVAKQHGDGPYSSRKQTRATLLLGIANQADLAELKEQRDRLLDAMESMAAKESWRSCGKHVSQSDSCPV